MDHIAAIVLSACIYIYMRACMYTLFFAIYLYLLLYLKSSFVSWSGYFLKPLQATPLLDKIYHCCRILK